MNRLWFPPPAAFRLLVTAIAVFSASVTFVHGAPQGTMHPGQVLTPSNSQSLISPGNTFSFGFRDVFQDQWYVSIWYTNLDGTIVWMANRNKPVTGRAYLNFTQDGELILSDPSLASPIWSTSTAGLHVVAAEIQDSGNLVLLNTSGGSLWQSFDYPTDTLLPEQPFKTNATLNSAKSAVSYALGRYSLVFDFSASQNFANLENVETGDQYWRVDNTGQSPLTPSSTFPPGGQLELSGAFCFNQSSGNQIKCFTPSDVGASGIIRRLKLDVDGNLRTYSWNEFTRSWSMVWIAIYNQCSQIRALCGQYGVCVYDPAPVCICPPGFKAADENDISQGCNPIAPLPACKDGGSSRRYVELERTDYPSNDDYVAEGISIAECLGVCSNNCSCAGAAYSMVGDGKCWTKSVLLNGHGQETGYARFFVKVGEGASVVNPPVEQGATKWGSDEFWQQQTSACVVVGP